MGWSQSRLDESWGEKGFQSLSYRLFVHRLVAGAGGTERDGEGSTRTNESTGYKSPNSDICKLWVSCNWLILVLIMDLIFLLFGMLGNF